MNTIAYTGLRLKCALRDRTQKVSVWRLKLAVAEWVRSLTYWAWRDILDRRYTPQEVADWLTFYRGRYRELTLTEWCEQERAKRA